MTNYPCPFCRAPHRSFAAEQQHLAACPERKRRLDRLGLDLAHKVQSGAMKLEAAEAEQAKRPEIRL